MYHSIDCVRAQLETPPDLPILVEGKYVCCDCWLLRSFYSRCFGGGQIFRFLVNNSANPNDNRLELQEPPTPWSARQIILPILVVLSPVMVKQATPLEPGRAAGPSEQRPEKSLGRDRAAGGAVRQSFLDGGVVNR